MRSSIASTGSPIAIPPGEASRRLKGFARHLGADAVGCTRLDPAYVYSHIGRSPGRWGEPIAACRKCAENCPSRSIPFGDKDVHAGVEKWRVRQETCYRTWRRVETDCALCVKVCPYSHPASPMHDLVRWTLGRSAGARRRRVPLARGAEAPPPACRGCPRPAGGGGPAVC